MSIIKRGKGYEVRIIRKALKTVGITSGQYSFTVTTELEAQREHSYICGQIDAGKIPQDIVDYGRDYQVKNTKTTVYTIWRIMCADQNCHYSQSTADLINGLLEEYGYIALGDFDRGAMLTFLENLKATKIAPGTIRKKVGAMRFIFRYAAISDEVAGFDVNVFDKLPANYSQYKGYTNKHDKSVKRDITRDRRLIAGEYEKVLKAIDNYPIDPRRKQIAEVFKPAFTLLFETAINAGMRLQEIFLMEWEHIDFTKRGSIYIPAVNTKGNKTRSVPMTRALKVIYIDYYKLYGRKKVEAPRSSNNKTVELLVVKNHLPESDAPNYILPFMSASNGSINNCSAGLSHTWVRMMQLTKIKNLHFHDLRHEGISRMVERTNFTMAQLMKISGHNDMRTFQRYNNLRANELGEMY